MVIVMGVVIDFFFFLELYYKKGRETGPYYNDPGPNTLGCTTLGLNLDPLLIRWWGLNIEVQKSSCKEFVLRTKTTQIRSYRHGARSSYFVIF